MDKAIKELAKIKYEEMAMYMDVAAEAPAFRGGAVSLVSSTKGLREASHKLVKTMGDLKMPGFTQKTTLEPNAEKIPGGDVDRITVKQEFSDEGGAAEAQQKLISAIFGDAGMQQLVMYQPNRTLQTTGGGKAELQALLASVDSSKGGDAAAATARKRLPAKTNFVGLVDLARVVKNAMQLAAAQDLPINGDALGELKLEPSFVGFALGSDGNALHGQLDVPLVQVKNFVALVTAAQPK
jgi:hypothetical protein